MNTTSSSPDRQDILLGGPNEKRMGLARAVRVGNSIAVGGTAAINADGSNVSASDVEGQARRCYEIVGQALAAAGARPTDVVRTRTMLVNIDHYEKVLAARKEFLGDTLAAETIVEVSRFVDPAWQVEIEVDAVIAPR
ncbi:MAG: Rid family hydrolase [Acidimicrobiales bacterium]